MMIHCQINGQWSIVACKVFLPLKDNKFPASMVAFPPLMIHLVERFPHLCLHKKGRFCTSILSLSESMWMTALICFKFCLGKYCIFPIYRLFTNDPHSQRRQLFLLYSWQETRHVSVMNHHHYEIQQGKWQHIDKGKWPTPISTNQDD